MESYLAHIAEDGRTQTVREHLSGTATLADNAAIEAFRSVVHQTALLHDIGKYSHVFQRRLNGDNVRVEHAICGADACKALWGKDFFAPLMEYCIAGHHTGLPDGGTESDLDDCPTLCARMKRPTENYSAYQTEITPQLPDTAALTTYLGTQKSKEALIELYAFFTRYVFSCLTDADFIDTERFCNQTAQRGLSGDLAAARDAVDRKLASFAADTPVRQARAALLAQAVTNAQTAAPISLLNMPTGSGKTLCSLKIALDQALREGKKRIIYVIPYTSIIEQTAEIFSDLIGPYATVLQHHSNFDFDKQDGDENEKSAQKLRRTCENWDAPIVVTTSVQFFQSVYHYRGSRLRKLHNMADAVIVFDEIHLLPIPYLQPCLRAVGYLTQYFNSRAIFLSATMPDYAALFAAFLPDVSVTELIADKSGFGAFRNCRYESLGKTTLEQIALRAQACESSLIIVNSRKTARALYRLLSGKKFHLSTYMTPAHRASVIAQIKACLAANEPIAVVSTSLVEAGVDFDFQTVFRQLAGLDNILQAGGRCNREGRRSDSTVYIFETEEATHDDLQIRANITAQMLRENKDIADAESIRDYYGRLFGFHMERIRANSIAKGCNTILSIPFRSYAEGFELIASDTIGVVICRDELCEALLEQLRYGVLSVKRKLQKYTVSVYFYELEAMQKLGILEQNGDIFVLRALTYYDEACGLDWNQTCDDIYIQP